MSLTPGQRDTVARAHAALTRSHQLSFGSATDSDLCRNIGRLEIALEDALRIIAELTQQRR